ncbi:MAG: phosphoribosyltransferase family protein [Dehalococcoidia bacterium]|nr:phosphoribosyltransferase family protein [Dehalococcoidia bacterium]
MSSGAFRYDGHSLEGAHVLLVDDVVTTGATANECARVLKDAGARTVRALAFTRASYQPRAGAEAIDT